MAMKRILLGVAASIALAASSGATPIPITFFHSPLDNGTKAVLPVSLTAGTFTINLWADPSLAGGGVTEMQDVILAVSGGLSVVSFTCDSGQGGCLAGVPSTTQVSFTAGDAANATLLPLTIGTLVLNVTGAGSLTLIGGTALDGNFNGDNIIQHTVVSFVITPEPATAGLLAMGLGGLALLGRKRRV